MRFQDHVSKVTRGCYLTLKLVYENEIFWILKQEKYCVGRLSYLDYFIIILFIIPLSINVRQIDFRSSRLV